MNAELVIVPEAPAAVGLVEQEHAIAAWLTDQEDVAVLQEAHRRLRALKDYYGRASAEGAAAYRLELQSERKMGQLLGPAERGNPNLTGRKIDGSTPAEQVASHRARQLADVPQDEFDAGLEAGKSKTAIMAEAKAAKEPPVPPRKPMPAASSVRVIRRLWHDWRAELYHADSMFDPDTLAKLEAAVAAMDEAIDSL